jgi:hypothetical protein
VSALVSEKASGLVSVKALGKASDKASDKASGMALGMVLDMASDTELGTGLGMASDMASDTALVRGDGGGGGDADGAAACSSLPMRGQSPRFRPHHRDPEDRCLRPPRHHRASPTNSSIQHSQHTHFFCTTASTSYLLRLSWRMTFYTCQGLPWS